MVTCPVCEAVENGGQEVKQVFSEQPTIKHAKKTHGEAEYKH